MDEASLAKMAEEPTEAELQERLKMASKNAAIFQNKVRDLNDTVDSVMARKKHSEEELLRQKKKLAELQEHLGTIEARYAVTKERLETNKRKHAEVRKLIKDSEQSFVSVITRTRSLSALSSYKGKETETNLVAGDLQADRGYSCKKGSTFGHIANITSKSYF